MVCTYIPSTKASCSPFCKARVFLRFQFVTSLPSTVWQNLIAKCASWLIACAYVGMCLQSRFSRFFVTEATTDVAFHNFLYDARRKCHSVKSISPLYRSVTDSVWGYLFMTLKLKGAVPKKFCIQFFVRRSGKTLRAPCMHPHMYKVLQTFVG